MLQCHEQDPGNLPGQCDRASIDVIVEFQQSLTHTGLEIKNSGKFGPVTLFRRDFRMGLDTM